MLTYLQAVVIGLLQGVTELFPISSLGHSILVPALIGGSWQHLVTDQSSPESPYLAFIVGLHVATALALLIFFRGDWVRVIGGFFTTLRTRRVETSSQRLAWLIVLATIPVGLTGLVFEHQLRTLFAKPLAAAIFLTLNGVLLLAGERLRRRAAAPAEPALVGGPGPGGSVITGAAPPVRRLATLSYGDGVLIGSFQIAALFAGVSRSGITMVGGLLRGLSHEDAARFSFLLATPVILAAGVLKIPDLFGPLGAGIRDQVIAGSVVSGVAAYVSVRFLTRYFETRTLTPFGIYCLVAGALCIVRFGIF
jgi:undecaprenyl-diphosphatase